MNYRQLNAEERSVLAALRTMGLSRAEIARQLGRHRSTVGRKLRRNAAPHDGYRARRAHQRAHARRYRSRRNSQFERTQWVRVEALLKEEWSPEQVSGHLALTRELAISHETISRHVWRDLKTGGNGTEFHWYGQIEALNPVKFYFATPHHSWERGTNENTNGLIRQYLPKGQTMAKVTQSQCDALADQLNNRPRKRHGYKTPNQCFLRH